MAIENSLPGLACIGVAGVVSMIGAGPGGRSTAAEPVAAEAAAPARDGNIAIREEYEKAVSIDTREAYQLFIDRHPHHPLAVEGRRRIERLR